VLSAGADNWVFERRADPPFARTTPFPLDHLIDCLESGRPTPASIDEARRSFGVAMAAYQSAREGRPVRVPGTVKNG
jgi:predicted dehydrogenase